MEKRSIRKTESTGKDQDKSRIRSDYLAMRNRMAETLAEQLSGKISGILSGWDVYRNAQTVFFYYPLGKEVSLLPVITDALHSSRHVAFPKMVGDEMEFYEISHLGELKTGRFHVMEPVTEGKQPFRTEPDLCFVPGAVFDRTGGRFGYGKGYYDRYFAVKKTVKLVGCAYGCQIADSLPTDVWDIRMNFLLCEHGIVQTGI